MHGLLNSPALKVSSTQRGCCTNYAVFSTTLYHDLILIIKTMPLGGESRSIARVLPLCLILKVISKDTGNGAGIQAVYSQYPPNFKNFNGN